MIRNPFAAGALALALASVIASWALAPQAFAQPAEPQPAPAAADEPVHATEPGEMTIQGGEPTAVEAPAAADEPVHATAPGEMTIQGGEPAHAHDGTAHSHDAAAHAPAGHGDAHGGAHGHHEDPTKTFNYFTLSYRNKDRYGGQYGDGVEGPNATPEQPMSAPFVLMLVNFGLLLVILAKFGGPAARKMAESRHEQIKQALDEASALRSKAAAKLKEYEDKLSAADAEVTKLVDGMRADAEAEKTRIIAAANTLAATMKRDAEMRIAAEMERARAELRAQVTAAATAAAEKALASKATAADQGKLFDQFLGDLQRVASQRPASPTSKEPS